MTLRPGAGLAALLTLALIAGCGSERAEPPRLDRPATPKSFVVEKLAGGEVRIERPDNWVLTVRQPPGIATVASGGASLTIWAYPAADAVAAQKDPEAAAERIVDSLAERSPKLEVLSASPTVVAGLPAVEIRTEGKEFGLPVETRTLHVYVGAVEYVIDAFAEREAFADANDEVFDHVIKTIRLGSAPPLAPPTKGAPPSSEPAPTPQEG